MDWTEFARKKRIAALQLIPRTDDNDINIGESYELFYWAEDGWISAGKKQAKTIQLAFEVPKNALYLLKNTKKGREDRIFIYENGKQIWF